MFRHVTPILSQCSGFQNSGFQHSVYKKLSNAALLCALVVCGVCGCSQDAPIVTYKISTKVPDQLKPGKQRMLVTMLPYNDKVWFFKVAAGPEKAIDSIEPEFRKFVETVQFDSGSPVLNELPEGWRRGGEKPMRFASIDVTTPGKQLDVSVSSLPRPPSTVGDEASEEDWNKYVGLNVNRWRGQLGLPPSQEKWAGGEPIELASGDGEGIWLDIVGESDAANASMGGSMMGGGAPRGRSAQGAGPFSGGGGGPFSGTGADVPGSSDPPTKQTSSSRLKFDRPDGWRDGRMSSMRWAAFNVGDKKTQAEVTVMPAGGDLHGNVKRWIGQVIGEPPEDDIVDKAIEDAKEMQVSGRDAQRFVLTGDDPEKGTAIDATIVPMEGGVNMFIKNDRAGDHDHRTKRCVSRLSQVAEVLTDWLTSNNPN